MKSLLLLGAGGLAREVIASVAATGTHRIVGVLDDNESLHGSQLDGVPVIGHVSQAPLRDEQLLVCIGAGPARERVVRRLITAGVEQQRFATCIDRGVRIPPGCVVGPGSILLSGVVLTASVTVGAHVVAMPSVVLTHDDVVADFATLAAGVLLGGGVRVGRGAYLGMGSSVRQRLAVGAYATLGMGGVLVDDLPSYETWAGVPARRLDGRDLFDHHRIGRAASLHLTSERLS
ncbi:acetyltransferase [Microlunatus elymi]|uniref:Acetyltransferase n=1 Tax=Microlunatus elymi TaxID=2596828 RepID=A0A516PTX6_9ACTN|nr:NeuD/PglB/VioB family sugar acetyltransferase [Microlunatus elymi]QDP94602.1 acetyltransferase [Microlunatus elymi]